MKRPARIRIPFKQRLRPLRTRFVPLAIFGITAFMTVLLWRDTVAPAMLVGEVSSVRVSMNSPSAATIQRMHAQHLEMVRAGDVIAELSPTDPRQMLDVLQGEVGMLRLKTDVDGAKQAGNRLALDYERLRLDWMGEKVALVIAEDKARKAGLDLEIARILMNDPAQSKRFLQEAEMASNSADAEAKERKGMVESLGARIAELKAQIQTEAPAQADPLAKTFVRLEDRESPGTPVTELKALVPTQPAALDDPLARTLARLEERLHEIEKSQSLVKLRAPMDGMVSTVLHRVGENVNQGDPLIVITAMRPENIVGYLRQPLPVEPAVGMEVEVRRHDRARSEGTAIVTRVGIQFELITNPALHPAATPEVGLPVEVSLPRNLYLQPGELVNLVIKPLPPQKRQL